MICKFYDDLKSFSMFSYSYYRDFYIKFKFYHDDSFKHMFKTLIYDCDLYLFSDDFIFLPISNSRHVDYLVRICANKFEMPFFYAFTYVRNVHKNCRLDRKDRFFNVASSLTVNSLPFSHFYCLFDDISTTGATFLEMRRALMHFGVPKDKIFSMSVFNSSF